MGDTKNSCDFEDVSDRVASAGWWRDFMILEEADSSLGVGICLLPTFTPHHIFPLVQPCLQLLLNY